MAVQTLVGSGENQVNDVKTSVQCLVREQNVLVLPFGFEGLAIDVTEMLHVLSREV